MRKKRREYLLPHYGQIVTTRHSIWSYLSDIDMDIGYNTAILIALGREHKDYYLRLYSICSKLCFLSKLIYRCEGGYRVWGDQDYIKMEEKYGEDLTPEDINDYMKSRKGFAKLPDHYYDDVFTNTLEFEDEALRHLAEYNSFSEDKIDTGKEMLEYVIRCKNLIAPICARLMRTIDEQFFIGEYAYVFDYVLRHKGELPAPEYGSLKYRMDKHEPFFPINYEGFDITDNLSGRFEEYDTNMTWY